MNHEDEHINHENNTENYSDPGRYESAAGWQSKGLFEVRYDGDMLDGTATIGLLEAINDMKKSQVPVQGSHI